MNKTVKQTKQILIDKKLIDKNDNVEGILTKYLDIEVREVNKRRCEPLSESKCK